MKQEIVDQLIDVLTNPNTDFKAIAMRIAKKNPEVFINAADNIANPSNTIDPSLDNSILDLLKNNNVVAAIRLYRNSTNSGLVEAKDVVEKMRKDWRRQGILPVSP